MNFFQILFLFFLIIPFIEIYVLLKIGGLIGAIPTVAMVVLTAVLGAGLLRIQGFATWRRFQQGMAQGQPPVLEILEGPILLVGGALLLTPGFFTDLLGFACLVPALRRKFALYLIENHLIAAGGSFGRPASNRDNVIEGEYKKED
ncbi:MAG: FxsA family protein [Gammaproteobacteria bacterium]